MRQEERSDKIALLFEEAVEIPTAAERAAFLARACAGDLDLQKQIEDLLRAHQAAGKFLGSDTRLLEAEPPPGGERGALSVGDSLGPYRLLGLVGEGASSIVFVAEQTEPVRRWVAVKVIKAGMDTRQVILRFELERQTLAVMDHPGIAKVLDAGATPNGRPFFVMELVRGLEITRHCDQHRLDVRQRLELFIQVCQAVLHAHQKGVVHRDIKPANILISLHDGHPFPKVIDFGIAKVLKGWASDGTPVTGGMPFLGTPAYMSPEQAQVTMPDLDTRTDIYSLGALLYELLVGHPPFDHHTLVAAGLEEMCQIIRTQEPVGPALRFAQLPPAEQTAIAQARRTTPHQLARTIAGDLEWITLKAIEKDREQRYETAATLAEDIHRYLEHLPVSAAAPTWRYRFSKLMRRNRKAVMTAGAVGLMLLVSTLVTGSLALHARRSAIKSRALQTMAMQAERQSHAAVVAMHAASGFTAAKDGSADLAALWFANAAQLSPTNEAAHALHLRRALSWLEQAPIPVGAFQLSTVFSALEFSPDSRYLLALDRNNACRIWDCASAAPLIWPSQLGQVNAAAWNPAGNLLALVVARNEIQVRQAADGALLLSTTAPAGEAGPVGFSVDGKYLFFGSRTVRAIDLRSKAIRPKGFDLPQPAIGFTFLAQTDRLAAACLDEQARVLAWTDNAGQLVELGTAPHRPAIRTDACSSKTKYRQDFLEAPVSSLPALADGGKVLVTRTGPYEVSLWDVQASRAIHKWENMCCSCRFLLSPDGTLIAGGLQGGKIGIWEVATGRQRNLLASSGACILDVAFGPAGKTLLTAEANGTARLWSLPQGKAIHSTMHLSSEVDKVAFAPNGRMIATAQSDGLARIWTLPRLNPGGYALASEYGPKVIRVDAERRFFVAVKEPAWQAEMRKVTVYSAQDGAAVGPAIEVDGRLEDATLSPGGRLVALAYRSTEADGAGGLEFREVRGGQLIAKRRLPTAPVSLAWDPLNHRVAAICPSGELFIFSPDSPEPVTWAQRSAAKRVRTNPFVAFTSNGSALITLTPAGALEIRESSTGLLRFPPLHAEPDGFWYFTVSPDSQRLATTTTGGQVRVWDLHTGAQSGSTLNHPGWVYRCGFSPDRTLLVTASHDAKCRIWDLRSGQPRSVLTHPKEVYDATFTPDGQLVLTACRDGTVRIWHVQTGEMLAAPFEAGEQAFTIEVAANGQYALIGSLGSAIHALSLAPLHEPIRWDSSALILFAEVVSGSTIRQGVIRELATHEWLQRSKQFHLRHGPLARAIWPTKSCYFPAKQHPAFQQNLPADSVDSVTSGCGTCGTQSCSILRSPNVTAIH